MSREKYRKRLLTESVGKVEAAQQALREEHPASRKLNGKQMTLFACQRFVIS